MLLFSQSGLVSGQVFTCGGRASHRFSKIIPNTVCLCCCIPLLCCRQEANNRKVLLVNSQCVLGDGSGRHPKGWSRSSRVFRIQTPPGQFVHLLAVWVWNLGLIPLFVSAEKLPCQFPVHPSAAAARSLFLTIQASSFFSRRAERQQEVGAIKAVMPLPFYGLPTHEPDLSFTIFVS